MNAAASSGLIVNYTSSSPAVATISGTTITLLSAGVVTVTATQTGNENYNPAPSNAQSFCVNPHMPVVTVEQASETAATLTSSSPSGNQWYVDGIAIPGATGGVLEVAHQGAYSVQVTTAGCKSEFSEDMEVIVTGFEGSVSSEVIHVYPNPATDMVLLEFPEMPGKKEIRIYNGIGVVMASFKVEDSYTELDVAFLSTGVYLVQVATVNGMFTTQFVKR